MNTIRYKNLNLEVGQFLLDMGCGEGRHSIGGLIESPANVIGLDLCLEDVRTAKRRLNDFEIGNLFTSCNFGVANINEIPFEESSLDAVICSEVLEHVDSPEQSVKELIRVLKPGGILALSVPRYLPELICWKLSKEYSQAPGGHVRIFRHNQLKNLGKDFGLEYLSFHWAHGLHSPYWWLQCLFWNTKDKSLIIKQYHRLLVWDLMKRPLVTRILEMILQPLIGKSLVMYFKKPWMNSKTLDFYNPSINHILEVQNSDGSIPWEKAQKLDPWDHVEACMGLSIAGKKDEAEQAFLWLSDNQLEDGSWYSEYLESIPQTKRRETNFSAYIATGLMHHYLIFKDKEFLEKLYPTLSKAIDFVISSQTPQGDIYWAQEEGKEILDDSLITGSSSIYKSLECAIAINEILDRPADRLLEANSRLKNSIINNPERYDRSWESKSRYSMDWYYPILCGVYTHDKGISIIDSKWSEFIVEGKGCKCVSEEPWVTVAESSELVMALVKLGLMDKAEDLFNSLHQWRDEDGLYWTGYVYTDKKFWPIEKPTWTAGAVLLAADTLYGFTPGHELFLKDWTSLS